MCDGDQARCSPALLSVSSRDTHRAVPANGVEAPGAMGAHRNRQYWEDYHFSKKEQAWQGSRAGQGSWRHECVDAKKTREWNVREAKKVGDDDVFRCV